MRKRFVTPGLFFGKEICCMERVFWGEFEGSPVYSYTVYQPGGLRAVCLSYGAALQSLFVPDARGQLADVVQGFDDLQGYVHDTVCHGATVGRVANRTANAAFTMHGKKYALEKNCGAHHLHGGRGFHKRNWVCENHTANAVRFFYHSPDGECGYPGAVDVRVTYRITNDNALAITYHALAHGDTPLALTNHSYFHLSGHDAGAIYDHTLALQAAFYTVSDADSIVTGEIAPVLGTPLDFTKQTPLGQAIHSDAPLLKRWGGYDVNYVLHAQSGCPAALVHDPRSGRSMQVYTDMPGIQLYTSNSTNMYGKGGAYYGPHSALCLETQYFPNAVNIPAFKSPLLSAGQTFTSETRYRFV